MPRVRWQRELGIISDELHDPGQESIREQANEEPEIGEGLAADG